VETLRALLPLLTPKADRSWQSRVEQKVADWWREAEETAMRGANPLNPARVFWELSERLPDSAILCCDCGTATFWYGQLLKIRRGMMASLSSTLATMGSGVPYALTAKINYPDRPVIALVGDGAMQMNGINALITVAQYAKAWPDPRLVVLVLNNRELSYVTWEQRVMEGNPKFNPAQDLLDFPYARYAELIGLRGIRVDGPDAVAQAWDDALRADRPVVIEAITDPNVPPLPPELTNEQKKKLTEALRSDPDRDDAIAQLKAADKLG
jgi:pyruvate dehydrogenase (quinone)